MKRNEWQKKAKDSLGIKLDDHPHRTDSGEDEHDRPEESTYAGECDGTLKVSVRCGVVSKYASTVSRWDYALR